MKRTDKHVKETAKPAQQPPFKTPAQELEEFGAKVLAMRKGAAIWRNLDSQPWSDRGKILPGFFDAEVERKANELWPEYARLLQCDPGALKAYRKRRKQHGLLLKVPRVVDGLRGRKTKMAERDALIVQMRDVENYGSFGKIAQKLKLGREVAMSAYYRAKGKTRTR